MLIHLVDARDESEGELAITESTSDLVGRLLLVNFYFVNLTFLEQVLLEVVDLETLLLTCSILLYLIDPFQLGSLLRLAGLDASVEVGQWTHSGIYECITQDQLLGSDVGLWLGEVLPN